MSKLDAIYMTEALKEAQKAFDANEVPVGAIIVHNGRIIARAHNQIKLLKDPTAHAEMIAITQAAAYFQNERLIDTTIYTTVEPCPMCAGAMVLGRIERLVYGADDPKTGAAGSIVNIIQHKKLNHKLEITKGVLENECAGLLKEFFGNKRKEQKHNIAHDSGGYIMVKLVMAALLFGMLLATILVGSSAGVANRVEFRLVLAKNELLHRQYDVIQNGPEALYVWKLHYLSDRDLETVEMMRSASKSNLFMIGFKFNKDGRQRLYRFTKKFKKRRVAIFADGKLVTAPLIWVPYFMGERVVVQWPGTERELRSFAYTINKKETIISLYIEETGKSNDIAADAWADLYGSLNKYVEKRSRQGAADYIAAQSMSSDE